jgi:hypothetical protein
MKSITRKCKYCLERYTPKYITTEPCWKYECRLKHLEANTAKINKANKAKAKDDIKSYAQRLGEAKKVFQKWIRMRDKDLSCQACLKPIKGIAHGCHVFKAELFSGVIFDERNCFIGCVKCNLYLNGNEVQYLESLKKRFGEKWVEQLRQDAHNTRGKKWSNEELEIIKKKYKV